jgi:hypothetical protein
VPILLKKSAGPISRASNTMSKDDSRYRLSLNHCFAPAAIVAAELFQQNLPLADMPANGRRLLAVVGPEVEFI